MPSLRDTLPVNHPARRAFRAARDVATYLRKRLASGAPDLVLTFGHGGIGDSLLCSAVCREYQQRVPRRIWGMTPHPALFAHNPDVTAVLPFNDDLTGFLRRRGHPVVQPHYNVNHWAEGRDEPPREHLIAALCRAAGITSGRVALRPYLHLTDSERAAGRLASRQISIQSSGRSARFFMPTKEWFPDRFAEVVRALPPEFTVIQLGGADDPLLPGTRDLRGRTTLRETAAILQSSELFVGLVGFLMHLARAVDCPGVIVYGGRERPEQSGYVANTNVARQPACSPCWLWSRCDHAMVCMDTISSAVVIDAINHRLTNARGTLDLEFADVSAQPPA